MFKKDKEPKIGDPLQKGRGGNTLVFVIVLILTLIILFAALNYLG